MFVWQQETHGAFWQRDALIFYNMSKQTLAVLRPGGIVVSNVTGKQYVVAAIRAFGKDFAPQSKEYVRFLECVPRSVFITAPVDGGVRIEIGIGLEM